MRAKTGNTSCVLRSRAASGLCRGSCSRRIQAEWPGPEDGPDQEIVGIAAQKGQCIAANDIAAESENSGKSVRDHLKAGRHGLTVQSMNTDTMP